MLLLPSFGKHLLKRNGILVLRRRLQSTKPAVSNVKSGPEVRVTNLANGMRVASENTGHATCTVGLYLNAGSRFETSSNNGAAHFLEQMAFKGTEKRNQSSLEKEVEGIGAQLNSSVAREHTSYYGKCLSKDLPQMMDILTDVTHNAALNDTDIESQRKNMLNELDVFEKNNKKEVVLDYLHVTAYQGTPLSLTVQGPTSNIMNFTRDDLLSYRRKFYTPTRMVLAAAGGVNHDELVDVAKQLYKTDVTQKSISRPMDIYQPCRYTGSDLRHRDDDMPFVHVALAIEGVGLEHPDLLPLLVANQIIGSWDRTSVNSTYFPNPLVRRMADEELCVSFQSFNSLYSGTGLWGIYFVAHNDNCHDCTVRIQDEWMRLCIRLTEFDVARGKNALVTNLALGLDGTTPLCDEIGRQMLLLGYRTPFHKLAKDITNLQVEDVRRVMDHYVWDTCPVVAANGPTEALPHYSNVRAKMYKVFH